MLYIERMTRWIVCALVVAACGPGRTTFASYPGAPATFDRAGSEAKALEIADKVFAAAGGATGWAKAKQIKWHQKVTADGKTIEGIQAWDRWNARHYFQLIEGGQTINVAYGLYSDFTMGFAREGHKTAQLFDDASKQNFVKRGREQFNEQTGVMLIQFLMFEPGAKIAYVGQVKDDKDADHYDELKVTFEDPARKSLEFHPVIDRNTNLLQRIELIKTGTTQKIGFTLDNWRDFGGMKFATKRVNLGYSSEITEISDVAVGDVDDSLYIAPVN